MNETFYERPTKLFYIRHFIRLRSSKLPNYPHIDVWIKIFPFCSHFQKGKILYKHTFLQVEIAVVVFSPVSKKVIHTKMVSYADILKKNLPPTIPKPEPIALPFIRKDQPIKKNQEQLGKDGKPRFYHIDVGVNFTHNSMSGKVDRLIKKAVEHNCKKMIVIGSSIITSQNAVALCRKWNKVSNNEYKLYCTVGVNPHGADKIKDTDWIAELETLIVANKDIIVAIGECGLDYERKFSDQNQIPVFESQLDLARKHNLPVYLHERSAYDDFIKIMEDKGKDLKGMIHCFSGNKTIAKSYVDKGLYLGISGWICDEERSGDLKNALPEIPHDRIVFETNAPYLTPKDLPRRPYSNGPQYIPHIANTVANILEIDRNDRNDFYRQIHSNVKSLFGNTL